MNKKNKNILISGIIVVVVALGIFLITSKNEKLSKFFKSTGDSLLGQNAEGGKASYLSQDSSFSFEYPAGFNFSELSESETTGEPIETLLFKGKNAKENFQIIISVFDENPITIARIKKEVPDLVMKDAQEIAIDGALGVVFTSVFPDGKLATREIWFSHAGKSYQISTYSEFDSQMSDILTTWKWNE